MAIKYLFLLFTLVSLPGLAIDKALKERIHKLDKSDGKAQKALVEKGLAKSGDMELSTVKQILGSKEYRAMQQHNKDRALKMMGLKDFSESFEPKPSQEETNNIGDRIVLFVSSSIPMHILRNYAKDIHSIGGVMIFRGTIDGISSMKPTMHFMRSMLTVEPNCDSPECDVLQANVSIDPERFTHHNIEKVPALIFERDMKIQAYCEEQDRSAPASVVVYGDSSILGLVQALDHYADLPGLKPIVQKLRGSKV